MLAGNYPRRRFEFRPAGAAIGLSGLAKHLRDRLAQVKPVCRDLFRVLDPLDEIDCDGRRRLPLQHQQPRAFTVRLAQQSRKFYDRGRAPLQCAEAGERSGRPRD